MDGVFLIPPPTTLHYLVVADGFKAPETEGINVKWLEKTAYFTHTARK